MTVSQEPSTGPGYSRYLVNTCNWSLRPCASLCDSPSRTPNHSSCVWFGLVLSMKVLKGSIAGICEDTEQGKEKIKISFRPAV